MSTHGTYMTIDGRPAVRFERRLAHPVDAVWRVVTDPAELAHWFPSEVVVELRAGGAMRFTFGPGAVYDGEVVELDPPHLFAFLWGVDLLRFELAPDGDGTRLTMLHVLNEEGEPAAAKVAAGWHLCLDAMARRLAGEHDVRGAVGALAGVARALRGLRRRRRARRRRGARARRGAEGVARVRLTSSPGGCRGSRVRALGELAPVVRISPWRTVSVLDLGESEAAMRDPARRR